MPISASPMLLFNMPWLDNVFYAIMALGWLLAAALAVSVIYLLVRLVRSSWRRLRSSRPLVRLAGAAVLLLLVGLVLAFPVLWVHYTYFWLPANKQRFPDERQHTQDYQDSVRWEGQSRPPA